MYRPAILAVFKENYTISSAARVFKVSRAALAKRIERLRARIARAESAPPTVILFILPSPAAFERYFALVRSATSTIDLQMFSLTHDRMVDFLIEFAAHTDTTIRVLVDYAEAQHSYSRVKRLVFAGVHVRWHQGERMHSKTAIIDHELLLTGSMNWTKRGADRNTEVALALRIPNITGQATRGFNAAWRLATRALPRHFSPLPPAPEPEEDDVSDLATVLANCELLLPGIFDGIQQ